MASVKRVADQQEQDTQRDAERWILQTWAQTQGIFHALRFGDELPPTKKEHEERKRAEKNGKEPPINWKEIEQTREQMLESRKLFEYGRQSPQHFGAFLGADSILGPPEETYEDFKARMDEVEKVSDKAGEAKAAEERLISMLEVYTQNASAESEN